MLSKETIQEAIRETLNLDPLPSPWLLSERYTLWAKREFAEMLEAYRARFRAGDRDNDPSFLPELIEVGLNEPNLFPCPFEKARENRLALYLLRVTEDVETDWDKIIKRKGWTEQKFLSYAVWTGLMASFPTYNPGDKVRIKPLEYPMLPYQPNLLWLKYKNQRGTITQHSSRIDPWEYVKIKDREIKIRKDWVFSK
jgi:hypothetical protein